MLFLCPYCHTHAVPAPPDTPRPHAVCQHCGAKPRAVISRTQTGERLIKYVRDGRLPKHDKAMQKYDVRLTEAQAAQARALGGTVSNGVQMALDAYPAAGDAGPEAAHA